MKKIMIIGAGDFQLPLVQKASEKYTVILVAPYIDSAFKPYISKEILMDVCQKEEIWKVAQEEQIDGITTDQTDIAVRTVAYVAEKLGLPGIGYETSCLFTDKSFMRKKMKELNIPQLPNQTVYSLEEAIEFYKTIEGRVIIKPLDNQGSRGVQACSNIDELCQKYIEAEKWSSGGGVMIERMAEGREFVVEGICLDYEFQNLVCGDTLYFDIPDAYAAKSRIMPTTAEDELYRRVLQLNERIITGFGLKQGITHSEFIMDGDEIYLIETAARGGGVFISSDLISLSTGICTEEFLLNIALGRQQAFPKIQEQLCYCGYMAFYIPVGKVISVNGVETISSLPYLHRNQLNKLKVGMENKMGCIDKTSRIAMIVSADSREELNNRMNYIRSVLQVEVETTSGIEHLIWE